jgi:hypothetical protein
MDSLSDVLATANTEATSRDAAVSYAPSRADTLMKKTQAMTASYISAREAGQAGQRVLEDTGELGRLMDAERWRKRVGLRDGEKVFVLSGDYPDIKEALYRRGWKRVCVKSSTMQVFSVVHDILQNMDTLSPHFDLKFVLQSKDIVQRDLKPHQIVNHFAKSAAICAKNGLLGVLRGVNNYAAVDMHSFFPRAYDLADPVQYADFAGDLGCLLISMIVTFIIVACR